MDGGIYCIKNKVNGKIYIGRTVNFKRRFFQYKYDYENLRKDHINEHLLNSMLKYGFDKFSFDIIEVCDQSIQPERELYWMNYFKTLNPEYGYNLRSDTAGAMVTHESTSRKISERLRKEWKDGRRSNHSEKLKESWKNRSKEQQADTLRKSLTRWLYVVDGKEVLYSELKSMKLQGVLCKFFKYGVNSVIFKSHLIERKLIES